MSPNGPRRRLVRRYSSSTISSGKQPSGLGAAGNGSLAPTSAASGAPDDDAFLPRSLSAVLIRLARCAFSLAITSFHESLS